MEPMVGCDKVAPKIRKQTDWQSGEKRNSWGEVCLTRTWSDPYRWESETRRTSAGVQAGNSIVRPGGRAKAGLHLEPK